VSTPPSINIPSKLFTSLTVAELLKIVHEPFAYRPHVLLALRANSVTREGVEGILSHIFLDAVEYLDKGGASAPTAEEWAALRKRFAKDITKQDTVVEP